MKVDITQTVMQTLANKIGKLEVENACLIAEVHTLQEQLKESNKEGE